MNKETLSYCAVFLLIALRAASAADPIEKLESIPDFAFGGIGVAGITSEGELAFRKILTRSTAQADFLRLLDSGNAQARCYALAALHVISPKIYAEKVRRFEKDKTVVSTIGGCIVMKLPMHSVVLNISAGRYDRHIQKK